MYRNNFVTSLFSLFLFVGTVSAQAKDACPEGTRDQLQQEHQSLLDTISHYNQLYEAGKPAITDDEYDALTQRQRLIHRCLQPHQKTTPSPPLDKRHRYPMGSLKKVTTHQEIENFLERARKLGSPIVVQPKLDGIAVELVYQNGQLKQALTRGQWRTGTGIDLLPLLESVPAVPNILPNNRREVVLRGELYALPDNPNAINAASPRHYVAGLLNREHASPEELKHLKFFPWHWANSPLASLRANIREFEDWGFTDITQHTHRVNNLDDISRLRSHYHKEYTEERLPLDGIVIKIDNQAIQKRLGHLDGTPYWAIAWKFPAAATTTRVREIRWTIGRTGQITVVIDIEPVQLQGVTVSTVNAGPAQHFSDLDIATNDTISVSLKGAATPVLGKVLLRPAGRKPIQMPDQSQYTSLTCMSVSDSCKDQFLARAQWLTGRNGLNLPDVDISTLNELIASKKIQSLSDVFRLSESDISSEAKARLAQPQLSLYQLIRTLSIPEVGAKRAEKLAQEAGNWQTIQAASAEQIKNWIGCSKNQAEEIVQYLHMDEVKALAAFLVK